MRIALLTQYFPPEVGAAQARVSELAEVLSERGHEVTVITAMPSYPLGRVFDGYGGLVRRERLGKVVVLRVAAVPAKSARLVPRMFCYMSFVLSSVLFGGLCIGRQDVLVVESPPLFLGLSGIVLAWAKRSRLVVNIADLWPESAVRLGVIRRASLAHRMALGLERLCYSRAWFVSGQSKGTLEDIGVRFPNVERFLLPNSCDVKRFGRRFATEGARQRLDPDGDGFVVTYAGLHGLAQGLSQVLDAAALLRGESTVRFALIGSGPEKAELVKMAEARGLSNVRFLDPVPPEDVASLLASSDAVLVTMRMYLPGAVPSKVYEGLASERPLLLMAAGEAAEIVGRDDAGVVLEPGDARGLASAILALRERPLEFERMCRRARIVAERFDSPKACAEAFAVRLEAA